MPTYDDFKQCVKTQGSLDFEALDVATAFPKYPQFSLSPITLTQDHAVDDVPVTAPVEVILTSLAAQITITISPTSGLPRSVTVDHDFLDDPVLTITTATLQPVPARHSLQ